MRLKLSNSIKFLIVCIIIYAVLFFARPELFSAAFGNFLQIAYRVIPLLALIFPIMFLVNYFVKPEKIKKHFGEEAGLKQYLYATIAGILISGPPYILYPMLGDLKKSGMSNKFLAIFLYNRNVKIPFIPVMIFYFGLIYTITISLLIILFSFLSAWIIGIFVRK